MSYQNVLARRSHR